jgi:quinol-cytochrome oxidoreductase complex cytochrome b subunit
MNFMNDEQDDSLDLLPDEEVTPYWTARRALLVIIVLITLLAFLFYTLIYPLLLANNVPPTPTPILNRA